MKASTVRHALRLMPLDKQTIKPFYRRLRPLLSYPDGPTIVDAGFGTGCFEIRRYLDPVQRNIYFFGYWERKETRLIRKLLRPGDVFIDMGANIGWFTVLGSRCVGASGKVVSFEPCHETYDNLQTNIRLNGLNNVLAENAAISDVAGTVVLSGRLDKQPSRGTIARGTEVPGDTVASLPFDPYWAATRFQPIRLLKMDIEGAEVKALTGMADTLRQKICDYLLIEVCNSTLRLAGTNPAELLEPLSRNGYTLYETRRSHGVTPLSTIPEAGHINILAARSIEDLQASGALGDA